MPGSCPRRPLKGNFQSQRSSRSKARIPSRPASGQSKKRGFTHRSPVLFREAERTRAGFGTVRLAGYPTARCSFEVEKAREGADERCVNPRFFDWPDAGRDGIRAFDLRDRC